MMHSLAGEAEMHWLQTCAGGLKQHICCSCADVAGLQARGAPILAEYLGGAVTCDAYHMTDPRADGLGVSTCIKRAIEEAGIEREQVSLHPGCCTSCTHLTLQDVIMTVTHSWRPAECDSPPASF